MKKDTALHILDDILKGVYKKATLDNQIRIRAMQRYLSINLK